MPAALAVALGFISYHHFLLFHTLAELFAIGVAALMCIVAWQTYEFSRNNFLMFLACGYFWVGGIDIVHTLIYKGMNLYPETSANPATQFWIIGRYLEALLLLSAPLFLLRTVERWPTFLFFGAGSLVMYMLVMSGNFPDAFIEGQGLTQFKIVSEYIIIALLAGALLHLIQKRGHMEPRIFLLMACSIVLTMTAELFFTFYVSVYGLSNIVGHFFKFLSYWLIFSAIISSSLKKPYFVLEQQVQARTRELSTSMEKTKAASRAKSELMANMSHELRTPLNAIIGFSSTMKEQLFGPLNEKYIEYAGDINSSGEHLLDLINDILDVSAIEAGKLELHEETLDIAKIIETSRRMVSGRAEKGRLALNASTDNATATLKADKRRLLQILLNLLSNAIKFTPAGGEVSISASLDDSNAHVFKVRDTGIGLDPDEVTKAMSAFGQVESSLVRNRDGVGLGLPLTQGLVELHGGTFIINSVKGQGTTVTVRFPPERTQAA